MKIKLENIKEDNIIIFDIEYDQDSLVQIALLILNKTEENIYTLEKSANIYIRQKHYLNNFFIKYTNITDEFLYDNGIEFSLASAIVNKAILNIATKNTLIVSHGLKNDLELLEKNRINLKQIPNHYCTYDAAIRLLKREDRLSLKEVAADGCYHMFNEHNAYADVWGTLYAFCFLNELENKTK